MHHTSPNFQSCATWLIGMISVPDWKMLDTSAPYALRLSWSVVQGDACVGDGAEALPVLGHCPADGSGPAGHAPGQPRSLGCEGDSRT